MTYKVMNIGLQKHVIREILKIRGNPAKTSDIEAVLYNLDYERHLSENISVLESEGVLLPVPFDEMDKYLIKQALREQVELDDEKYRRVEMWLRAILWNVLIYPR